MNKVSIPDLQPKEQKISDTPIRKKDPEATVPTGQLHKEIIYEKGEFLAVDDPQHISFRRWYEDTLADTIRSK